MKTATVAVTLGLVFIANSVPAQDGFATKGATTDAISVEFSGQLLTSTVSKPDSIEPEELASAEVVAAGTTIYLDWSKSDKIRDELLWWSTPRAGDIRTPHAAVKGRMVFRPLKAGGSAETPVPIVVVDSIEVYLAGPDGRRRGPQPNRGIVVAEECATE